MGSSISIFIISYANGKNNIHFNIIKDCKFRVVHFDISLVFIYFFHMHLKHSYKYTVEVFLEMRSVKKIKLIKKHR